MASLDRLVDIMAREGGTASALADILHRMDQALYEWRQWVESVLGVGSNIGERLHKAVFVVRDQRDKISSSCLVQPTTVRSCCSLPTAAEIATYCPAFVTQYSSDLHMLVWLLARYYRTGKVQDLDFQLTGAGAGCW